MIEVVRMKLKKSFIIFVGVLIFLISTFDIMLFVINRSNKNNVSTPVINKVEKEDLNYADDLVEEYEFELGNEFPVVENFTANKDTVLKIYYNADEVNKIDAIGTYKLLFKCGQRLDWGEEE